MKDKSVRGDNFSFSFFFSHDLKAKYMTPAMEEVALLRKKSLEYQSQMTNEPRRLTRSRVAQLKSEFSQINQNLLFLIIA